jgi:hypothetical protein
MAKGAQSLSNSGNVHLLYIRHDFELVKSGRQKRPSRHTNRFYDNIRN